MERINDNFDVLEQLRKDYSELKNRLDEQEIINDRLLRRTFEAKVRSIHSVAWTSFLCGLFVLFVAPFAFHFNPGLNASWAFVIGTDLMMIVCMTFTYLFHKNVSAPQDGDDLLTFAKNVKKLKADYQGWLKYAVLMVTVWFGWLMYEIFQHSEDQIYAISMAVGVTVGLVIGGIVGYKMNLKVIRQCDEIIASIEE